MWSRLALCFQPSSCFSLSSAEETGLSHHSRLWSLLSDITVLSQPLPKGGKGGSLPVCCGSYIFAKQNTLKPICPSRAAVPSWLKPCPI